MNRPTAEQFAAAPLFVPYVYEAREDALARTDYKSDRMVLEGFVLTREALGAGHGMKFSLEGHSVMEVVPKVEDGVPTWVGTFFDDTVRRVQNMEVAEAAAEFAGMIHESLRQRVDTLVFYMEERGVRIGQDAMRLDARELGDDDGIDHDDDDADDYDGDYGALAEMTQRFGEPVRIVRQGFGSWVEGREAREPWGNVRDGFARAAEDGTPVCPASMSITQQIDVMENHASDVSRHRLDLRSLRQSVGNPAEIMDMGLRASVHVFDMVDSEAKDTVLPQASIKAFHEERNALWELQGAHHQAVQDAIEAGQTPPEEDPALQARALALVDPTNPPAPREAARPLDEIIRETTGFSAGAFTEVRSMPNFAREQMRAIGRMFLAPHLGDMPMERVVVGRPSSNDPEAYAAFMEFFREGELVKEIGEFRSPSMPGYTTSPAEIRRRDGWDSIVFSDFGGTYAYSFPTPAPAPGLDPEAEPEPEEPEAGGFRFG